jgi:glycolate oxidase iron-sulfur subunit
VEPDAAQQLGDRKTSHIASVQPDVVATANPGCMLQIRAGAARQQQTWSVVHPIELLDAAIRGKGVQEL